MSKKKTDIDPKKVEKEDARKEKPKIREGQENSSVWGDQDKPDKNEYPRKTVDRKQYDDEPEFKERDADDLDEA
jgi:hypothetical protein